VKLVYGNAANYHRRVYSSYFVGKLMKINPATVENVVKRFVSNGNKVRCSRKNSGRRLSDKSKDILQVLRSPDTLQNWAHFTLRQRVSKIMELTGHSINPG
jgi:hypothetical protein